jgi:hypothetical protein
MGAGDEIRAGFSTSCAWGVPVEMSNSSRAYADCRAVEVSSSRCRASVWAAMTSSTLRSSRCGIRSAVCGPEPGPRTTSTLALADVARIHSVTGPLSGTGTDTSSSTRFWGSASGPSPEVISSALATTSSSLRRPRRRAPARLQNQGPRGRQGRDLMYVICRVPRRNPGGAWDPLMHKSCQNDTGCRRLRRLDVQA